jgi:GAF domain-containing protein
MEAFDLLNRLARLSDPHSAAERVIETAAHHFHATAVAVFSREQGRMALVNGRGIDSPILDLVERLWRSQREELLAGKAFRAPATDVEPRRTGSFVLAPVLDDGTLWGLLYVEAPTTRFQEPQDTDAVATLCTQLASSLSATDAEDFLGRASTAEVARQQLLVLLERHEWNLARVARELGVTRATIYNRLARHGIERRRIPKTVPRPRPA